MFSTVAITRVYAHIIGRVTHVRRRCPALKLKTLVSMVLDAVPDAIRLSVDQSVSVFLTRIRLRKTNAPTRF